MKDFCDAELKRVNWVDRVSNEEGLNRIKEKQMTLSCNPVEETNWTEQANLYC